MHTYELEIIDEEENAIGQQQTEGTTVAQPSFCAVRACN